jgi:hypothetical protein
MGRAAWGGIHATSLVVHTGGDLRRARLLGGVRTSRRGKNESGHGDGHRRRDMWCSQLSTPRLIALRIDGAIITATVPAGAGPEVVSPSRFRGIVALNACMR